MSFRAVIVAAACGLLAAPAGAQTPQGTSFTYQGRLADGGTPADGAFDFLFILYDAAVGGSQVGPIVSRDDVAVTGGLFTVPLDFGAAFGGSRRWLDVSVRPGASTGTYTPIVPRQELAAAPNALFSAGTTWTGVAGKPAGFADDTDNDALGGLACGGGQVAKWNGNAWTCAADANSGGTVTSVAAGSGLSGGTITGAGTLSVSFGGGGQASTVARSDHNHHGQVWTAVNPTGLTVESSAPGGTGLLARAGAGGGFSRGVIGESTSTSAVGVYGHTTAPTSATIGVHGFSESSQGMGVYGEGGEFGVRGQSASTFGVGVFGWHTGTAGLTHGVRGWNQSTFGRGVSGAALATSGDARGVEGQSNSTQGTGVYGWATTTLGGPTIGVVGRSESSAGRGVVGYAFSSAGSTIGVSGESWSTAGRAVQGRALGGDGAIFGVYGWAQSSAATGVYGEADLPSGLTTGVHGVSASSQGRAVFGSATATAGSTIGLRGQAASSSGYGVYANVTATAGTHYGVFGQVTATSGYAGYFSGRVHVSGTLSKAAGSFKIDHPLDPEHKYLYHSFVESPDMKNVYDGVVTTDGAGFATVRAARLVPGAQPRLPLPADACSATARGRAPASSARSRTTRSWCRPTCRSVEVSWQVTGIRQDAYAEKHRIPVEEDKPADEQGPT